MNSSKQPILFAAGTFFTALLLSIFGGIFFSHRTQQPEQLIFYVQAAPQYTCQQAVVPKHQIKQIEKFIYEEKEIPLAYPLSDLDSFVQAAHQAGYTITTKEYHEKFANITLHNVPWGTYKLTWGTHITTFSPVVCE